MANCITRHIPNTVTCCNLFSGCIASVMAFKGNYELAITFIIIGAVFDFFDGMLARLLKVSGPLGKELDSLADDHPDVPSALHGQRLCLQHHRAAAQRLPATLARSRTGRGPSFHTQLWQSLVGHDGTDRRQQCPARILRGKIPRQTHDRSHCRTSPARVETQLAHGLDRCRNRLPQVQPDEKPSHPAQLWCGLSMGIQEERQRASRLWFRQGRTERIPLQYQRSILKEYFWS